ncbi:hypothetical protein [Stratiformator vulcanicus]|nr:hypothetical protein [Stratiformator vulcanicus]
MGCATAVVFVCSCGGLLVLFGWNAARYSAEELERSQRWEQFSTRWLPPPADVGPAAMFPSQLGDYELVEWDETPAFAALKIDLPGAHGEYRNGDRRLDLHIYRASTDQKQEVYQTARELLDDGDRFHFRAFGGTAATRMFQFRVAPHEMSGNFWYAAGWLVFARSAELSNRDLEQLIHQWATQLAANPEELPPLEAAEDPR